MIRENVAVMGDSLEVQVHMQESWLENLRKRRLG